MSKLTALDPVRLICGVEFAFPDYKEPLVQLEGAVKGYMRGTLPYAVSDGRLPCAFCDPSKTHRLSKSKRRDNLFDNLGRHVSFTHGMSGPDYREAVGLLQQTPLASIRVRDSHRAVALAGISRGTQARGARRGQGRTTSPHSDVWARTPEYQNKRGICRDQILAVARAIAKKNGNRLFAHELRKRGVSDVAIRRHGWPNARAIASEIGATWWTRGWTEAEMLGALREAAATLGRKPTQRDLTRLGAPSVGTLTRYFGGYAEACAKAGLPVAPNVRRPIPMSVETEIKVLSAYAYTGSIARVTTLTRHSQRPIEAIFAKYGVIPSLSPTKRRKAQAWAAEIAQRLAP
jgi:hypothetical protein